MHLLRTITLFATTALVVSQFPIPPEVTEVQKQVVAAQTTKAKAASKAATQDVLSFFDSQDFRAELKSCCPEAAQLSAQDLLERFRAEVRASELAHSFPAARRDSHFTDVTIDIAKKYDFFLNEWQVPLLYGSKTPTMYNLAEEGIFGCPHFEDDGHPTWNETADRMIYIVQNTRRMDFGSSPTFGDVSVIFKNSHVQSMVLIAAVDTGLWEMSCNYTDLERRDLESRGIDNLDPAWHDIDCKAWQPPVVGTLEHFDHLILANLGSWKKDNTIAKEAGRLFERSAFGGNYLSIPPMQSADKMKYFEANILMNPRMPEGIQLIIGDFARLFGTDKGSSLQQLAQQRGWPLAWSRAMLGQGSHSDEAFPGNGRTLDPTINSSQALNASFPASSQDDFAKLWSAVEAARSQGETSQDQWQSWWATLASQQVQLAPLTAFSCSAPDSCVGLDASSGHCICHPTGSPVVIV